MAVALRGSAAVPTGNPTTGFTVTIPSQVAAGDLLFIAVTSRDNLNPALGPTCTDDDTGGNAWAKLSQSADGKATVWWKRATSGTASKTVTIASCLGSASGVLKAFSGGDGSATPYSNVVQETNASGNETHAGFTPAQGDSMACAAVFNYANDNGVTSLSFATLGATTATEKLSTGGSDCGTIFGHALQSGTPAATGNLTWAQTDGTTYSITWAVKPAVTGTGAAAADAATASGVGVDGSVASGTPTASASSIAGEGAVASSGVSGDGALGTSVSTASGNGVGGSVGSGTLGAAASAAAGEGIGGSAGFAALAVSASAASGAGVDSSAGSGAVAAAAASVSGQDEPPVLVVEQPPPTGGGRPFRWRLPRRPVYSPPLQPVGGAGGLATGAANVRGFGRVDIGKRARALRALAKIA